MLFITRRTPIWSDSAFKKFWNRIVDARMAIPTRSPHEVMRIEIVHLEEIEIVSEGAKLIVKDVAGEFVKSRKSSRLKLSPCTMI